MTKVSLGGYSSFSPGRQLKVGDTSGPLSHWLDEYWNKLVSPDPDSTDGKAVFLRTSPNRDASPLRKDIAIKEDQMVFVPWRTCEYDIDDGITDGEDIERWKEVAKEDMDAGDQPFNAVFKIDGHPIVENLAEYFCPPHAFDIDINSKSTVKDQLRPPFSKTGTRRAVAAGYIVPLKLQARKHPYKIKIEANGKGGYQTKATYNITVKP